MQIRIDQEKLTAYLNSRIDIPYLPETAEYVVFGEAVAACAKAAAQAVASLPETVDFITVEDVE